MDGKQVWKSSSVKPDINKMEMKRHLLEWLNRNTHKTHAGKDGGQEWSTMGTRTHGQWDAKWKWYSPSEEQLGKTWPYACSHWTHQRVNFISCNLYLKFDFKNKPRKLWKGIHSMSE
jgi:hypothetical protein